MAAFKLLNLLAVCETWSAVVVSHSRRECAVIGALQGDVGDDRYLKFLPLPKQYPGVSSAGAPTSAASPLGAAPSPPLLMQFQPRELISPAAGLNVSSKAGNLT